MSQSRTPLGQISTNRRRGPDLSPYQRGQIIGLISAGLSKRKIVTQLRLSNGAIQYTLRCQKSRPDRISAPHPGHPPKFTSRETRKMLRCVRIYPKMTFAKCRAYCDTKISNSHIKNLCRETGLSHWRAKKRPELSEEHAKLHYKWCQIQQHWDVDMWQKMMFSDECSVERGTGKKQIWVFGQSKDKWKPAMVETYTTGKNLRIMVWGMFWGAGRSSLYIMDRDFESKKYGYTANSYIEVLDTQVARHHAEGLWFVHDNAPIHTANKVKIGLKNSVSLYKIGHSTHRI